MRGGGRGPQKKAAVGRGRRRDTKEPGPPRAEKRGGEGERGREGEKTQETERGYQGVNSGKIRGE